MRLLFVEPAGRRLGGAERSLAGLTEGLVARGHSVTVLTKRGADAIEMFAEAGASIETTDVFDLLVGGTRHGSSATFFARGVSVLPNAWTAARAVAEVAEQTRADVVHSNGFRTHILAPMLRTMGCTVTWSLRDFAPHPMQRRLLKASSVAVARVLANSKFTASQIPSWHRGVRVVGNPVVLRSMPSRASARENLDMSEHARIVAVIGHLHPSKGQHIAVQAVQALRRAGEFGDVALCIAGAAVYGDESTKYATELGASADASVHLLGPISDIEQVYAAADVIVQPSIHPEGFGRTVVEAQLAGVPVIATAIGGATELINDHDSGLLIAPDDVEAMRSAIATVLNDHSFASHLVEHGKTSAQRFTVSSHVDVAERAWMELMSR